MDFFCYHRDRHGSMPLRERMVEEHWSYMDGFADAMIARGPTFAPDGTLTGSVHALDLPDVGAARAFAFEEPGWQAGAYRDVLLRRWRNTSGRTMWELEGGPPVGTGYLVLGFTEPSSTAPGLPHDAEVVVGGHLLSDDGAHVPRRGGAGRGAGRGSGAECPGRRGLRRRRGPRVEGGRTPVVNGGGR